jgi:hypothetical protein
VQWALAILLHLVAIRDEDRVALGESLWLASDCGQPGTHTFEKGIDGVPNFIGARFTIEK